MEGHRLAEAYMLTGKSIYTMDDRRPRVEAVGVIGDRIVAAGSEAEVRAALPLGAARFELGARTLLPGFTDSHNHFAYLARKWRAVDLDGCADPDDALARVDDFLRRKPDVAFVEGHGWDPNVWDRLPTRFHLDRVAADRPCALTSKDGHALWVNSAALQRAGLLGAGSGSGPAVHQGLPFDEGLIVRDETTGEPTGILYETAAKYMLKFLPAPDAREVAEAVAEGIPRLHAQGIVAVHCPETVDDWRAYRLLRQAGRLGVRVTYWLPIALLEEAIALGMATGVGDEWLRLGPVKLFADGTLGQRTAAMSVPYETEPDNRGVLLYADEELKRLVVRAAENGFQVSIHAIGDRAVRQALDALAAAGSGLARLRHRIEHAQIVHPDDVHRFRELGVVASMQPLHCPADRNNADKYWGDRTAWAFAFRTLKDAGVKLAFGSDAPFGLDLTEASFSVLAGVDAAVNRRTPRAWADPTRPDRGAAATPSEPAWHPEQRLSVEEALRAFTIDAAWAGGEESWRGSLTPGKAADMVLLDSDLDKLAPEHIGDVRVEATVVAGRVVFGQWPSRRV